MKARIPALAIVLGVVGLAAPLGCGEDDGLGKRYQLSGQVTYNGQPVPRGTINFLNNDANGRPASAEIKDGYYSNVTTQSPGDGILPGSYQVTVIALEDVDDSKVKEESAGGAYEQVAAAKVAAKAKRLIPAKYADPTTSGLSLEIKPETNTHDLKLGD